MRKRSRKWFFQGWERLEHVLVEGKRSLVIKIGNIVWGLLCVSHIQQLCIMNSDPQKSMRCRGSHSQFTNGDTEELSGSR